MSCCPCCSDSLLRHIRPKEIYWFCTQCHQEMPNLSALIGDRSSKSALEHQFQLRVVEIQSLKTVPLLPAA